MSYTHYWRYQPDAPVYAQAWPTLVLDTAQILAEVHRTAPLAGPDRTGPPLLDMNAGIAFTSALDVGCDGFRLLPPGPHRRRWFFCKTRGRPYDLAVTSTLLHCHLAMPDTFAIGSEAPWHRSWQPARDLVRRLFAVTAAGMPLTDTTAGLTVEQLLGL
jgi:hypothetical protein